MIRIIIIWYKIYVNAILITAMSVTSQCSLDTHVNSQYWHAAMSTLTIDTLPCQLSLLTHCHVNSWCWHAAMSTLNIDTLHVNSQYWHVAMATFIIDTLPCQPSILTRCYANTQNLHSAMSCIIIDTLHLNSQYDTMSCSTKPALNQYNLIFKFTGVVIIVFIFLHSSWSIFK